MSENYHSLYYTVGKVMMFQNNLTKTGASLVFVDAVSYFCVRTVFKH